MLKLNQNKQMKKALLIILVLFAGMLIAGTFDAQTAELEKIETNLTTK